MEGFGSGAGEIDSPEWDLGSKATGRGACGLEGTGWAPSCLEGRKERKLASPHWSSP